MSPAFFILKEATVMLRKLLISVRAILMEIIIGFIKKHSVL
jgi:hypothetical protein